jgi:hypothetical protein
MFAPRCVGSPGGRRPVVSGQRRVADAMISCAVVHDRGTTVGMLRDFFTDDHVHSAVILDEGRLLTVVDRGDLDDVVDGPAVHVGRLAGRVARIDAELESTRRAMLASDRRRLAVVTKDGDLAGLLCLKRTGQGFCSDSDVAARAGERDGSRRPPPSHA